MKIIIEYESSWRNSFLHGSNNEPLPKGGRRFIGSITELKKDGNFKECHISADTVMGILNRLIGDQRKLYQSRISDNYFFRDIESRVGFNDQSLETSEMTYIRNITGSTDQNTFTGAIKLDDKIFNSDYSKFLWGVLALSLEDLSTFILDEAYQIKIDIVLEPLSISSKLEQLNKLKPVENTGMISEVVKTLMDKFNDIDYTKNDHIKPISLYCSALYLQLTRLSNYFDISSAKTKLGNITGISKLGFTKKDFMDRFTTGEKKRIWGNPYIKEVFIKGVGKDKLYMTKASGKLEINIDIDREKAKEIKNMIENAGVSSFYLGKKGLAYVTQIDTRE